MCFYLLKTSIYTYTKSGSTRKEAAMSHHNLSRPKRGSAQAFVILLTSQLVKEKNMRSSIV